MVINVACYQGDYALAKNLIAYLARNNKLCHFLLGNTIANLIH